MKNSKLTALVCGLIAIFATIITYVLIFDNIFKVTMQWLTLMFLLIAEVIAMIKLILLKKNIITVSSLFTSVVHFAVTLFLSILFVAFFKEAVKTIVLLNILLFCALAIVDIVFLHLGKSLFAGDKKLAQSQAVMDACYSKAQNLIVIYNESEYKNDLVAIAELIKYSDNSELTNDEVTIMTKLDELEEQLKTSGQNIRELIAEIKNLINQRTIKMKSIKRGNY